MSQNSDRVIRAMTDDGSFRAVVAATTSTVSGVLNTQNVTGQTSKLFADLVTGTVLFREMMAPQLRVQTILSEGQARLIADSNPSGQTRGLVQQISKPVPTPQLQLMRTMPGGSINQGVVEVPANGDVSEAFMTYMQTSEQVTTMTSVGMTTDSDKPDAPVTAAGGYMLQLLPEAERGHLMVMTERLEDFRSIDTFLQADFDVRTLLDELLHGIPFTIVGEDPVNYGCWCSAVSLMAALATLKREDIDELVSAGEVLEITCDYCHTEYKISPHELKGMLDEN
jgi:molecular chaperone Hsp33